jgi:ACS family tartrate transporter-like MFS transporter
MSNSPTPLASLADPSLPERTRRRVAWHLLPYLFFLYILAYVDRTNVSVAMAGMQLPPDQGGVAFNGLIAGFGTGLFFWGYWILEIPSAQSVLTFGARWVFVRILVLWGLACLLIGFIGLPWFTSLFSWLPPIDTWPGHASYPDWFFPHRAKVAELTDPGSIHPPDQAAVVQFYFLRFMLGVFEGGFFPTVIFYLSIWFRPKDRGRAMATFLAAIPVSGLIGTPFSQAIMDFIQWGGLPGWRWIYIIQGAVPILAGFVTLFFLPNRPEQAKWLPDDEKQWLIGELAKEQDNRKGHGWGGQVSIVLLLTTYYFCMNVASYGLSTFLPTLMKTQSGLSENVAGYVAALPYLFAVVGMVFNGWHSDKYRERVFHTVVPLTGLSLGLVCTATAVALGQGWLAAICLIVLVGPCMYAHLPAFWPIPTIFMGAAAAAAAIGFINMLGNLGGSVGPTIFGAFSDQKRYAEGLFLLSVFPLGSVAVILFVGWLRRDRIAASRAE